MHARVMASLRETFRPEFLNRIDEIIVFDRPSHESLRQTVDGMLRQLRERLDERELKLELTDVARDWLVEHGYDNDFGARPLRRLIQRKLENKLAREVLAEAYQPGDAIRVDVSEDALTFQTERALNTELPIAAWGHHRTMIKRPSRFPAGPLF
jgi:ATP-dependent Clp protease ATP-binding subunit ClpA